MNVYIEKGSKLVFASAVDWPGYARSGKTEEDAIERLLGYAPRYAKVAKAFKAPKAVKVTERLKGGSGTDFGVISVAPKADDRKLTPKQLEEQIAILKASWKAFDAAAKKHARATLAKGPRGGGRELAKIVAHVNEGDAGYVRELGARVKDADAAALRRLAVETLKRRADGWEPEKGPRRKNDFWSPSYYVRRATWHVLDHLWEIEDRAS